MGYLLSQLDGEGNMRRKGSGVRGRASSSGDSASSCPFMPWI